MSESGPDEDVPIVVPPPVAPEAAPYPSELEGDITISRGDVVHLRPIRPSDGEGLVEFHRGLSDRSVYRRFFFVHPTLSTPEVEHFTHVDYTDRLALVAEDGGRIVAVGRYERSPGTTEAEVAFVVTDAYQGRGIATVLLAQLAEAALPGDHRVHRPDPGGEPRHAGGVPGLGVPGHDADGVRHGERQVSHRAGHHDGGGAALIGRTVVAGPLPTRGDLLLWSRRPAMPTVAGTRFGRWHHPGAAAAISRTPKGRAPNRGGPADDHDDDESGTQ